MVIIVIYRFSGRCDCNSTPDEFRLNHSIEDVDAIEGV